MNPFLKDKVVLITGASSGIGKEIALEASKCGAIVILCARREELLVKTKKECDSLSNNKAHYFILDVSSQESIDNLFLHVSEKFGSIDVLVNNAGFGRFVDFVDFDLEVAQKMFLVNTFGLITLTQKFAKIMQNNKQGHIINVISQAAKMASPESSIYSSTKFATLGFTNAIRLELSKDNIFVTSVNPGPVDTEFFDAAQSDKAYVKKVGWIVLDANKLAKKIVKIMGKNRREINAPMILEFLARFYVLFPHVGDFLAKQIFKK